MPTEVIAYVTSSTDNAKRYPVIRRDGEGDNWACNCAAFYFDPTKPCKHINKIRTLKRVQPGMMTLKSVQLTEKGQVILADWRTRNGMPLIAPARPEPEGKVADFVETANEAAATNNESDGDSGVFPTP